MGYQSCQEVIKTCLKSAVRFAPPQGSQLSTERQRRDVFPALFETGLGGRVGRTSAPTAREKSPPSIGNGNFWGAAVAAAGGGAEGGRKSGWHYGDPRCDVIFMAVLDIAYVASRREPT